MPRCGDCEAFLPQEDSAASSAGICNAFLDEDGCGKVADVYMDASECPKFTLRERTRTDFYEFHTGDHRLRLQRGFDEK